MPIVILLLAIAAAASSACSAGELASPARAGVDSALADAVDADAVDGPIEAATEAGNDAVSDVQAECCEISPTPMCCMYFGGSSDAGSCIGMVCDMIPRDLTMRIDEAGCPYWYDPPGGTTTCNPFGPDGGGPPP